MGGTRAVERGCSSSTMASIQGTCRWCRGRDLVHQPNTFVAVASALSAARPAAANSGQRSRGFSINSSFNRCHSSIFSSRRCKSSGSRTSVCGSCRLRVLGGGGRSSWLDCSSKDSLTYCTHASFRHTGIIQYSGPEMNSLANDFASEPF